MSQVLQNVFKQRAKTVVGLRLFNSVLQNEDLGLGSKAFWEVKFHIRVLLLRAANRQLGSYLNR